MTSLRAKRGNLRPIRTGHKLRLLRRYASRNDSDYPRIREGGEFNMWQPGLARLELVGQVLTLLGKGKAVKNDHTLRHFVTPPSREEVSRPLLRKEGTVDVIARSRKQRQSNLVVSLRVGK